MVSLFFVSCKKDYTCTCTNSFGTYEGGDKVTARTKKKADKLCDELSSSATKCTAK
jgi:hypothetical protein